MVSEVIVAFGTEIIAGVRMITELASHPEGVQIRYPLVNPGRQVGKGEVQFEALRRRRG